MASQNYSALPSGAIRVLIVYPGAWEDDIRCELQVLSLESKSFYEALSYEWGDANDTRTIYVDGQSRQVTKNLKSALRHIRRKDAARILWIDALCINQLDNDEVSRQVRIMSDIFACADVVLAWTGEERDNSDHAIILINQLAQLQLDHGDMLVSNQPLTRGLENIGFDIAAKDWAALLAFLQRSFWKRLWVVQELASYQRAPEKAHHCLVICGSLCIWQPHFNMACQALSAMWTHADVKRITDPNAVLPSIFDLPGLQMRLAYSSAIKELHPWTTRICVLLDITRHFRVSKPQDRLYAFLGLCQEVEINVDVDYSRPVNDVFCNFVRTCITKECNLDCIGGNRLPAEVSENLLPELRGTTFRTRAIDSFRKIHAAADEEPRVRFESGRLRFVRGFAVGCVKDVFGTRDSYDGGAAIGYLEQVVDYCQTQTRFLDENAFESLWKTVIMDLVDVGRLLEDSFQPDYSAAARILFGLELVLDSFDESYVERSLSYVGPFLDRMSSSLTWRTFVKTDSNRFVLGPCNARPGDLVAVVLGSDFLLVLRPRGDVYSLVGDAYSHGLMQGEMIQQWRDGKVEPQDFELTWEEKYHTYDEPYDNVGEVVG